MLFRLLFLVLISASLFSCRKSDRDNDKDTQSSQDYLQAQSFHTMPGTMALELLKSRPELNFDADTANHYPGSCPAITVTPAYPDSTTYPKTLTLDYGTSNCSGADGLSRRGKLVIMIPANPFVIGNEIRIATTNYFVNDKEMKGTYTLQFKGYNSNQKPLFIENISNAEFRISSTLISYFSANLTREWKQGDTTSTKTDDEFSITGLGSGIGIRGTNYSYEIKTPLSITSSCPYIQSGTASMKPGNLSERMIDYGSGCDATGKTTIFGTVYDLTFN